MIPPTTPPAMAPVLVDEEPDLGVVEVAVVLDFGVELVIGVKWVIWKMPLSSEDEN